MSFLLKDNYRELFLAEKGVSHLVEAILTAIMESSINKYLKVMILSVNGQNKNVEEGTTLQNLLEDMALKTNRSGIALCVNLEVIPKEQWPSKALKDNDRIEIVIAAPGG